MNNIQKAFKAKSKLRGMVDGGQVGPRAPDAAIGGASGAPAPAATAPVPDPAATASAKGPEKESALRSLSDPAGGSSPTDVGVGQGKRLFSPDQIKIFNSMSQAAVANAAQLRDLGVQAGQAAAANARPAEMPMASANDMSAPELELADGGKVKGKGGPTDDKVGPVMLSDGEYVLPADTVDIVGRDKLDALRLATHDFVDDRNKPKVSGLRKMADGGTFYVDSEGVASRGRMPPGRAVVPYQPPAAPSTPPRAGQVIDGEFRTVANTSKLGTAARVAGNVLTPAIATYDFATDSPEARNRAASGQGGVAGAASKLGSYLGSALSAGTSSPQDIGGMISALRGEGAGAYLAVPDAEKGWARRLGEKYFPTEAAKVMADRVQLTPASEDLSARLKRHGFDLGNMSEDDFTRARALLDIPESAPGKRPDELPGMRNVPEEVRTSSAGMPTTPVQPMSYQSRRLAEMGVPLDQQNLAPVTEDTRRSLLREGGGTPGQYVNLGSYGGDANIYGTSSRPGGRIDTFVGVGASSRPGGAPPEDPLMGEIRAAVRGLTDGAGGRGNGGGAAPSSNARDINARFDKQAVELRGMYGPKGQGNLARRLQELEQARANALDADARNQTTLRGQDVQAATAAANARVQALQTLSTMLNQRNEKAAAAQDALRKGQQDAQKDSEGRDKEGVADLVTFSRNMFGEDDPRTAEFQRYIVQTNPDILSMGAKERNFAMTEAYVQFLGEGPVRERAKKLGAPISQGRNVLSPEVVDVTLGDVWNDRAELGDWRPWSTDNYQMVDSEGNPVLKIPANEYIRSRDGSRNADLINDLKRRSALRSQNGE